MNGAIGERRCNFGKVGQWGGPVQHVHRIGEWDGPIGRRGKWWTEGNSAFPETNDLELRKLWEFPTRGVVLKGNEELVSKVIGNDEDYTKYALMQYLADNAPDIRDPKSHSNKLG